MGAKLASAGVWPLGSLERGNDGLFIEGLAGFDSFRRSERPYDGLSRHHQRTCRLRVFQLVHSVQGGVITFMVLIQIQCDDIRVPPRIAKNFVRPNAWGICIRRGFCAKKGRLPWIINMLGTMIDFRPKVVVSQDRNNFGIVVLISVLTDRINRNGRESS